MIGDEILNYRKAINALRLVIAVLVLAALL